MSNPDGACYECHLTFEPVEGELLKELTRVCYEYGFRVANLVMIKARKSTPERSNKDTFCTAHSTTYEDMFARMGAAQKAVEAIGVKVWRRKIEHILLDNRYK